MDICLKRNRSIKQNPSTAKDKERGGEGERGTAAEWITEPVSAHNCWNTPLPDCPPSSSAAVEADQKGFSNNELALPSEHRQMFFSQFKEGNKEVERE